jgi:hypothetical protein
MVGGVSRSPSDRSLAAGAAASRRRRRLAAAGWSRFHERLAGYGLPSPPRVRPLKSDGPLATLVIAYRN